MQRINKQKHLLGKVSIDGSHRRASSWPLFDTVRFIHRPLHQAFGAPAALHEKYHKPGGYEICSTSARSSPGDFLMFGLSLIIKIVHGYIPLGLMVGLVVLSVPRIRSHFYNLFYRIHIPMYVAYLRLLFWNSADQQDSLAYFWAARVV